MESKEYLQNDILPFWLEHALDRVNGGIFTQLDREGGIYGREKSVWFQGRALWTFSRAYNTVEKRPEYLAAAKCIYDFLPKCTDFDDRMFFTVTEQGRPLQKRRYYFSETFAAIGCAEYYKASGDPAAWDHAQRYFNTAYGIYKDPSRTVPKLYPDNAPFKALSPVMILLNTAFCMAQCAVDTQRYVAVVNSCLEEILRGGYLNCEVGGLLEQVTVDGRFYSSPATRVVNPGHSLECAWFLMDTGVDEALAAAKKIIDMTMPLGWDKKHGGLIAFTDILSKPPIQLEWDMKLWWPQCEGIIANRMAYAYFGDAVYKESYEALMEYVFTHFADRENGEWYGYLHYDNTPSATLKGNLFKGPFHIPRMLMKLDSLGE